MKRVFNLVFPVCCLVLVLEGTCQDFGEVQHYETLKEKDNVPVTNVLTVGITGGLSFPLGEFASSDYLNYYSGFAGRGVQANILNMSYRFHKYYGVGANWFRSTYSFDASRYYSYYSRAYSALTFEGMAEKWIVQTFTASLVATVPGKLADLDVRWSMGLGRVTRPELASTVWNDTTGMQVVRWTQAETTSNTLCLGAGFNVRIHVIKGMDVFITAEYQRMKPTFTIPQVYNGSILDHEKMSQVIEVLHTGIGLGLIL